MTSYGVVDSTYFDPFWFILWTHKSSNISWYKNVGTTTQPAFKYMDGNIFDLISLKLTAAKTTFGDLDGDGDQDMLVGHQDTTLIYFENTAGAGNMMSFAAPIVHYQGIGGLEFAAPELFDINGDSLLDLVIGHKKGLLTYYQNTGTKTNPVFTWITDSMGHAQSVNYWNYYQGYSVPEIYHDDRDSLVMMVGSASGKVFYYRNIAQNVLGYFGIDSNLTYIDGLDTIRSAVYFVNNGNVFEFMDVGMRSSPAVYDFDGDDLKDMVVGNFGGGLNFYKGRIPAGVGIEKVEEKQTSFKIFPNPASDYFILSLKGAEHIQKLHLYMYNVNGELVAERIIFNPSDTRFNFSYLPTGVYLLGLELSHKDGSVDFQSGKVLIQSK